MRSVPLPLRAALLCGCLTLAMPAFAQEEDGAPSLEGGRESVFSQGGDFISLGLGIGVSPSYEGSDDYTAFPVPLIQGRIGGVSITPRPAGFALDLLNDRGPGPTFAFGPSLRLRSARAADIRDPVVESLGELDRALEVGPRASVSFPGVLHGYDSVSLGLEARWDVLGAHEGMILSPSIGYFTPLSRGAVVQLSLSVDYASANYMDYYFSLDAAGAAATGLPQFQAEAGFTQATAFMIGGYDFSGDLTDGGWALFFLGAYSRMLGDAAASPFTADRGSPNQLLGAIGLGYTF